MPDAERGRSSKIDPDVKENIYKSISLFMTLVVVALAITLGIIYTQGQDHLKESRKYKKESMENMATVVNLRREADELKQKMADTTKPPPPQCEHKPFTTSQNESNLSPFDDLTADEYKGIDTYLTTSLGLTTSKRTVKSSYVFLMDLKLPAKADVLEFLNETGTKPDRMARAIVFRGDASPPVTEEYDVTISAKGGHTHKLSLTVPWTRRPNDDVEIAAIDEVIITPLTERIYSILMESYKASYHNCTDQCLTWSWINPVVEERQWWFIFQRALNNEQHHPVGLQILVNVSSVNTADWEITKLVYNFQAFDSVDEFVNKYNTGNVTKLDLVWSSEFSTHKRRPTQPERPAKMAPELFEPEGKRYSVRGRHIEYMGWSFDFRISTTRSLQLYDVKFQGERVAYEIGAQETATLNGGFGPVSMGYNYLDTVDIRGWNTFELFRGVDCPRTAVFFDIQQYRDGKVKRIKNAVCVFELDAGIPLRRHYTQNFDEPGNFIDYGGLADHVLVLRTIVTLYNYNYIYDYIFHQNGAIEVKCTTVGYSFTTMYGAQEQERRYAYQVQDEISAPVNQFLVNYKVDLDIQGTSNRAGRIKFTPEAIKNPWTGGQANQYHVQERFYAKNESQFPLKLAAEAGKPGYFLFFNDVKRNKYNRHRAYRLKIENPTEVLLDPGQGASPGYAWSRYPVAITKQRDEEVSSSSVYNGVFPSDPVVNFQSFIDGDKLDDQDLVAWVTLGEFRLPSTNDMPTETSTSVQMKFLLLPYNYHNEDPSMTSPNSVYVTPGGEKSIVERYGTKEASQCMPPMGSDYSYDGKVKDV